MKTTINVSLKNVASLVLAAFLSVSATQAQGIATRTITGKVTDGKKTIAGVPVTDGINFVTTDARGCYRIVTLSESKFIYITTPAGYDVPVVNGTVPQFYKTLNATDSVYDFTLSRSKKSDKRHSFLVFADVQATYDTDYEQFTRDIIPDVSATITDYRKRGVKIFGTDVGDFIGGIPQTYMQVYARATEPINLPFFRSIGNHDMDCEGRSYESSFHTFEQFFGPINHSHNCGDAHYVFLDNNFFAGIGINYIGYLPEQALRWLEQDIALVPKDKVIFIFMHIATGRNANINEAHFSTDWLNNARHLFAILNDHTTHIITGHTHSQLNIEYSDRLYEHNTAAVCGTWWRCEECMDGTPRGYAVFDVDGTNVTWRYKCAGYDSSYQMRVYAPGSCEECPDDVVANVWNYDSRWRVELLENGKVTAQMTQFTGYDPISKAHCLDKSVVLYDWISPHPNGHMFRAKPSIAGSKREVRVTDRFGNIYISEVK
ncbi:MAG: calcineurin-like phosphoesterase C-terminal domain-containing protein [Muribaculaceae bacterium]